jgi:hypothetical protein
LALLIKVNVYKNILIIVAGASIGETFTLQMDNFVIPYILFMALG